MDEDASRRQSSLRHNGREAVAQAVGVRRAGAAGSSQSGGEVAVPGMMKSAMIVAGVMSGTSADGINVALVRIGDGRVTRVLLRSAGATDIREQEWPRHTQLLGHAEYSYPKRVREAVLAAMNASHATVADLARLNFVLGELYADAVL